MSRKKTIKAPVESAVEEIAVVDPAPDAPADEPILEAQAEYAPIVTGGKPDTSERAAKLRMGQSKTKET